MTTLRTGPFVNTLKKLVSNLDTKKFRKCFIDFLRKLKHVESNKCYQGPFRAGSLHINRNMFIASETFRGSHTQPEVWVKMLKFQF